MTPIEATISPQTYAAFGATRTADVFRIDEEAMQLKDFLAEDPILRVVHVARLHDLIRQKLAQINARFVVKGVNLPFCGPNAATDIRLLKLLYGDDIPIVASDKNWEYVGHAREQLRRIRNLDDVTTTGVELKEAPAEHSEAYSQAANLTIMTNVPFWNNNIGDVNSQFKSSLDAIKMAQKNGYLIVTLHNNEYTPEARLALEVAGFTIVRELPPYPTIKPTDAPKLQDIAKRYGNAVVLICKVN